MKNFLLHILFLLTALSVRQQSTCFISLGDATGIEVFSSELSQLEAAACALIDSLPAEFRDSFKVFDAGFYLHAEFIQGGFYTTWDKIKIKASLQSPYYLLFGKQLNNNKRKARLWIELKLPAVNDSISYNEAYVKSILNEKYYALKTPFDFVQSMIESMALVQQLKNREICDNGVDDDGDGFIDCDDIDCILYEYYDAERNNRSLNCTFLTSEQIDCIIEHYDYLMQNQIYDTETAITFCDELQELKIPYVTEISEISNGIDIVEIYVPETNIDTGYLLTYTRYRNEHYPPSYPAPDMRHGKDGNSKIISSFCSHLLNVNSKDNEDVMLGLLNFGTYLDRNYWPVAIRMMNKFKSNMGGSYEDNELNSLIIQTNEVKNKIKEFGFHIQTKLIESEGNFNHISWGTLGIEYRYVFSANKGYMNRGPTILINDVSQVKYYLKEFSVENSGIWQGTFYVEVIDHFGLDDKDPNNKLWGKATYQFLHCGFAAWWILQHQRDYKPFLTKIRFIVTIQGNID